MSARKSAEDAAVSEEPEAAADDPQAAEPEPEQLDEAQPPAEAEAAPEPEVDPFQASQEHTANAIAQRRSALIQAERAVSAGQADINRLRVEIDALNSLRAAQGLSQL